MVTRRRLLVCGAGLAGGVPLSGRGRLGTDEREEQVVPEPSLTEPGPPPGLKARPSRTPAERLGTGLHRVEVGGREAGLLAVPAGHRAGAPAPFIVMFHGAGGEAGQSIDLLRTMGTEGDLVVLAPESLGPTWTSKRTAGAGTPPRSTPRWRGASHGYRSIPGAVVAAGFSDGASYALVARARQR